MTPEHHAYTTTASTNYDDMELSYVHVTRRGSGASERSLGIDVYGDRSRVRVVQIGHPHYDYTDGTKFVTDGQITGSLAVAPGKPGQHFLATAPGVGGTSGGGLLSASRASRETL